MDSRRVCADRSCHPNATIIRAAARRNPLSTWLSSVITSITTAPRLREDRLLNKRISAVNSILHFNSTLTTSYGLTPPLCGERAGVGPRPSASGVQTRVPPPVLSGLACRHVVSSCRARVHTWHCVVAPDPVHPIPDPPANLPIANCRLFFRASHSPFLHELVHIISLQL